jgi:hypothetical protein
MHRYRYRYHEAVGENLIKCRYLDSIWTFGIDRLAVLQIDDLIWTFEIYHSAVLQIDYV